jgi:hypothetical protein
MFVGPQKVLESNVRKLFWSPTQSSSTGDKMIKKYTLPELIEQLVIPDLDKMVAQQLHYYAFSVICQAIEVMGAAIDQGNLDDFALSETRFTNALASFFRDIRYRNNQTKLFKYLRGPLIHQLRPGEDFFVASETRDHIDATNHLGRHESGATLMIIEPFLRDFKEAFGRFKRFIAENRVPGPERFTSTFLIVTELAPQYGQTKWDPAIGQTVTLTPAATGSALLINEFRGA